MSNTKYPDDIYDDIYRVIITDKQSFRDRAAKVSISHLFQNIVPLAAQTSVHIASFLLILLKFLWILMCLSLLPLSNGQDDNDDLYQGIKLCSNGSAHSMVDGMFEYAYWDSVANAPVYKRSDYVHLYYIPSPAGGQWQIHYDPTTTYAYAYCSGVGTEFSLNPCISGWEYSFNGSWAEDANMRLVNCTDICVRGCMKSWLNGKYIWKLYNRTLNGSVYYCEGCDISPYDGSYLYPFYSSNTSNSYWMIAPDHTTINHWSYCYVNPTAFISTEYVYNLEDCLYWKSYDPNADSYYFEINMTVTECRTTITSPIPTPVPPIQTPISIPTILWFIIAILVITDVIIIAICIYYIQKKLLQRIKEPYNAPWFAAIKQFGFFHFLGICMEIYDIGTDYTFSVDLILEPEPRDLTKVTLGWAALVISAFGLILFVCKYMVIRKLVGKQVARYRHQLKTTKNEKKRLEIMEKIRIRMMDIDVLSLFNGCIEDVPTTIIVLIIFTNYGFSITSILCITGNVVSFGLKVTTIILGKYGCKDVTDEYDQSIQPLEEEKQGSEQDIVVANEGEADVGFTHSTHPLLELQNSEKI